MGIFSTSLFSKNQPGRSPLNGLLTPASQTGATASPFTSASQVTPLPPVADAKTGVPLPTDYSPARSQWAAQTPATVTNNNVWKNPDMRYVSPLSGLLDQSDQLSLPKSGGKEVDDSDLPQLQVGGGGFSEATLDQSDYVDPFMYLPYQPSRRFEVL